MSFTEAVAACFRRFAVFEGRAGRAEYWYFVLFSLLGSLAGAGIDVALYGPLALGEGGLIGPVTGLFSLVVFIPGLAVTVRRLHDRNMRGWLAALYFLGPLSFILLIVLAFPGTNGPNRFGPDPRGGPGGAPPPSPRPMRVRDRRTSIPRTGASDETD